MPLSTKKQVLFVGAHKDPTTAGHVGGQMFACDSLVQSSLAERIEWHLLDTTATTNKARSFLARLRFAIGRLWRFRQSLTQQSIDHVLIFSSDGFSFVEKGLMAKYAKRKGIPTILAPRSGFLHGQIENDKRMRSFAKSVMNAVDHIIMQGVSWQNFFHQHLGVPREKLVVIPNWIDASRYQNTNESRDPNTSKGLFLGWIEPNKGVADLLHAIHLMERPDAVWRIAGDGNSLTEMKELARSLGIDKQVKFLGWVDSDEKMRLLQESDFLVLPSYAEGLPNALLEAMASGLPCVVSAVGAVPDVVEDGKDGFLITPGDQDAIRENCLKLIDDFDLRREMGQRAAEKIEAHYSVPRAVDQFSQLFFPA